MKQIKTILTLICFGGFLFSCTQRTEFASTLDRAEQQNRAYDSITNIDSIKLAVAYYDNHGTANERVRAHYLLGCAYRDAGEAPLALESYHYAADCADTTTADCDYRQLMVVHSQMASLFYEQLLPYECKAELESMYKYALLAKDTLSAINATEQQANVYELLNEDDSVIVIRKQASRLYKEHGYKREAVICLEPIIDLLISKGYTSEAYRYIQNYETESGVFDNGEINPRKTIFYYVKGNYYLSVGQTDSAQILYRKLLFPNYSTDLQEAGCRGLYLLYKKIGQKDSLAKYADLCYKLNEEGYILATKDNLQQMHSLYNYSRTQQLAQQISEKAHRQRMTIYIVITLAVIVLILLSVAWWKKQQDLNLLKLQYDEGMENLKKAKADLEFMETNLNESNEEHAQLLERKNNDILAYEEQIKELKAKLKIREKKVTNKDLMDTPIYQRIREVLTQPKQRMCKEDWIELRRMIDEKIPTFYAEMNRHKGKLQQQDYDICILVRLFFSPKDIVILTNNTASGISMKRSRLLKRIFGIEGSPEKFDEMVQELF